MLRIALFVLVAASGCGAATAAPRASRVPPAAPAPEARGIAIVLDAASRAKLSPLAARYVDERSFIAGHYTPMLLRGAGEITDAERAALAALGGMHLWDVTTTPGTAGAPFAKASEVPTETILVHVVAERVADVVALPWVTRVDVAGAYPSGPRLPEDVVRRLGPQLHIAISKLGPERPAHVRGLGKTSVCLDAARRKELTDRGAVVSTTVDAAGCAYTLFTFEVATDQLVELASLPWIVKLEGSRPMHPHQRKSPRRASRRRATSYFGRGVPSSKKQTAMLTVMGGALATQRTWIPGW